MKGTRVHIIIFLTFINLSSVRSVTCLWENSFEFQGKCFQYDSRELKYSEARDACLSIGGVLATVKSKAQIEDAAKHIPADIYVWIGANDNAVEGNWVWEEDLAPATELSMLWDYGYGEPNNRPDENCAVISTDPYDMWVCDAMCYFTFSFLCMEKDPASSTITRNNPATTNTAVSTTEISATTNTAASTTKTSDTNNTAGSTTETTATTDTAALTTDTNATALMTSTELTTSTTSLTATTVTTTTNSTNNAVLTPTSTAKVPRCALKKNRAGFADLNVLLLINLYVFNYLII